MKKTIFAVLAVVMAIAMMGSAFAYFTDVTTSKDNTITAGTLSIEIANQGGTYSAGPVSGSFNASNIAPGQSFETNYVAVKNTGSIDIPRVYARFGGLTGDANNFGDKLMLAYYATSINGAPWVYQTFTNNPVFKYGDTAPSDGAIAAPGGSANAQAYIDFWNSQGASGLHVGYITLDDLVRVRNFGSGDKITSLLLLDYRSNPSDTWPYGSTLAVKFGFLFDPTANNTYQGASLTFGVNFIASQTLDYPDTSLADYVVPGDLVP